MISKQKQMCGPFHAMVVNPNVVGERMKILWYAVFLKSWLRLVLFWFTLVSSSVCLVFFFTSLESKDLKMFISKDIFYQQVKLYMAFSMIIEQQHTIFPLVRPAAVIFFSWPFIWRGWRHFVDNDISWTLFFKKGDFSWTFPKGDFSWTLLATSRGQF